MSTDDQRPSVERVIRVTIQGVVYECSSEQGDIKVYGEPLGENEFVLSPEDADALMSFLGEVHNIIDDDDDVPQRRARGSYRGGTTPYRRDNDDNDSHPQARNIDGTPDRRVGPRAPDDPRGKVLDPEHDGRLRGNEDERPNDPDRSRQREGGRRGGSARRER